MRHHTGSSRGWFVVFLAIALLSPPLVTPASADASVLDLDLEDLLQARVTSPSKRAERLEDVPAAVHVVTAEDLRRSGVTSIPDALRLVPGLQVAQVDAGKWAVSCRGFNDRFANKMLVLVDGRTVYTELFAGVFWEALDTLLEDVERIEVIRGPGASVWGANAVNGVVNIITNRTDPIRERSVHAGGASSGRRTAAVRSGGSAGNQASYRVYGKYTQHNALDAADGGRLPDQWHSFRTQIRYDRAASARRDFGLVGEFYAGRCGNNTLVPQLTPPYLRELDTQDRSSGHSLMARWSDRPSASREAAAQTYYTHLHQGYRDLLIIDVDDLDLELTHSLALGRQQSLMTGVGYRMTAIRTEGSFHIRLDPARATSNLGNGFVQYDARTLHERIHLLLGTKVEYKSTSGWDVQPTARALLRLRPHQAAWIACSRAVRTPSGAEQTALFHNLVVPPDASSPGAPATVVASSPSPAFSSEELVSFEAGYRGFFRSRLQLDAAAFENHYDHLRSARPGTPYVDDLEGATYLIMPMSTHNEMTARTRGLELSATLQAAPWCRVGGSYARLQTHTEPRRGAPSDIVMMAAGNDPDHQASAHVNCDVGRRLQLYAATRYVSALPDPRVPAYHVGDISVIRNWSSQVSTTLGVRNIGSGGHQEFQPLIIRSRSAAIPTSVFGHLSLRL